MSFWSVGENHWKYLRTENLNMDLVTNAPSWRGSGAEGSDKNFIKSVSNFLLYLRLANFFIKDQI